MPDEAPYGGQVVVVDASAWIKLPRAPTSAQENFANAAAFGNLRGSTILQLEVLWGMDDHAMVEAERQRLDHLRTLPVTATVCHAAIQAMITLAENGSPGNHKVDFGDLLTAAIAQDHGFAVLHHDEDYDKLKEVLQFKSIWFAPQNEGDW